MTQAPQATRGWWREYAETDLDPVLRAAIEAFNEVGYHGATVRDIARRAGLSVAGIYHHHAGKQEMLFSILQSSMSDLLARNAAARADGGDDPKARFCNQIETLALSHMYWQAQTALGSSEMRALSPRNRAEITRQRSELQQHIQTDVDAAIEAGIFTTPYPKEAVRGVVMMCIATGQWFSWDGPLTPNEVAQRCVTVALDAMRSVAD